MKELILNSSKKISSQIAIWIEKAKMTEHTFMILMALLIGAVTGYGVVFIRYLIKEITALSFGGGVDVLSNIMKTPWYLKLTIPTVGGLIVGPLIYFFAKEVKRSGVPGVMESVLIRGGIIRPRVAFFKAITTALTIGTGGSVGREGPIVQIGSSIGSTVGQFFRVSAVRLKTFVGCGAAAGIAAAFNAPIAGSLFAVEIILQDFAVSQFSPIIIASVMATVISHHYTGNFAEFKVPAYQLNSYVELLFYAGLAVLCGILAYAFIKSIYFSQDVFDKKIKIPEYLKPALGGLLLGALALAFPHVMGVGYDSINKALNGDFLWKMAAVLILAKVLATSITVGSGASGGVFAPSLFLGAMTGIFYAAVMQILFPSIISTPGAYALVAMGGFVSATTHAPITAILMIFELTNDYHIILPLMVTCIISTVVSSKLTRESIYTLTLIRKNVHMKNGTEINVMKSIFVKDVFTSKYDAIHSETAFDEVVNQVLAGQEPYFPVIDKEKLIGLISFHDIKEYLYEKEDLRKFLIAKDVALTDMVTISIEDNCQSALEKLTIGNLQGMPVVDPSDHQKIYGMIWRKEILGAYNREIERRDITASLASKIMMKDNTSNVQFLEGYSINEIDVPIKFVNRSIRELNIRANYNVDILVIKSTTKDGPKYKASPDPSYKFQKGDAIVISGEIGKINTLKDAIK